MSGIEVVGFVLGGFPLLISAAEHYKEGFEPLAKWFRFRDEFIQFIDAVATQKLLFDQTLERFLISADVPDDELQQLMKNTNYEGWHRTDLVDLLKTRLGPAYDVYMSSINRMNKLLLELQQLLLVRNRKNGEFEVEWARDGANRWKYQMQRICLSFSKKGNIIVEELERHNKKLAALLESKDKLDSLKATKKDTKWANIFDGIRCHANNLYTVLKKGWNCDCEMAHSTALRLQHRKTEDCFSNFNMYFSVPRQTPLPQKVRKEVLIKVRKPREETSAVCLPSPISDNDEYLTRLRREFEPQASITARPELTSSASETSSGSNKSSFRDILSKYSHSVSSSNGSELLLEERTTMKWLSIKSPKKTVRMDLPVEIPMMPAPQQTPPVQEVHVESETATEIKDLCSTLGLHLTSTSCFGYLEDEATQRYEFQCTCEALQDDEKSYISLDDLLNNAEGITFSRQQRYKIASVLASSLLQLQATPWLQEKLDKKNIFFCRQGTNVLFDHPYVRNSFKSTKRPEPTETHASPLLPARFIARNNLNSLGTLLLELCFGKPVEKCELRKYHLGADGKAHERTNWSTTRDWAEMVGEEDPRLENIINCCVFDVLSLQQKPDWEDKNFVQAVYLSVVEPLDKLNTTWQPNC